MPSAPAFICSVGRDTTSNVPLVYFSHLLQKNIKTCKCNCCWIFRIRLPSCLSKRSWQIVTLLCFCSSVSSFGTIFAHTFLMSRSSVKIFLTVSLSMFTCSAMLLTVSQWFSHTIWRRFEMFSSVLLVADCPDLSSSVTLYLPSEKHFIHM